MAGAMPSSKEEKRSGAPGALSDRRGMIIGPSRLDPIHRGTAVTVPPSVTVQPRAASGRLWDAAGRVARPRDSEAVRMRDSMDLGYA
jgi:hypothetical protein